MKLTEEQRVKKAHIALMKHPETALYSGVMMMGTTEVIDDAGATAYTDGINKKYGRGFLNAVCKTDAEVAGLVLHENLHVALRHMINCRDLFKENRALANKAADYVVNGIIMSIKDKEVVKLPEGGLYDMRFANMSMREVYRILKEEQEEDEGGGGGGDGDGEYSFDEHDTDGPEADQADIDERVDRALREGALLAGRLGAEIPRAVEQALAPQVDWREVLKEFISSSTKGADEYTWRKFNRRVIANDIYLPSMENETVGEVVVAIDTSGSIGQAQLDEFGATLKDICEAVTPEAVRVLWWDTKVHGEQLFKPDSYQSIGALLKPQGGGGTRVGCVPEYLNKKSVRAECLIVFTDGYVEANPVWSVSMPTLWLVTSRRGWTPPAGQLVMFN